MKKIILFFILALSLFGLVRETSALSYNWSAIYSAPRVVVGTWLYQTKLAWDQFINSQGVQDCSSRANFNPYPCNNFPYPWASNDVIYYKYDDGITLDVYDLQRFLSIELDFNGVSNTGAKLLAYGGFRNYDQNIKYDFYLQWSTLHYRVFYHGDGNFTKISDWSVNLTDLPSDWSLANFGGMLPKRMVLNLEDALFSKNDLLGADTWIRAVSIEKITSESKTLTLNYEWDKDFWRKLFNSFSALPWVSSTHTLNDIVSVATAYKSDFPYVSFSWETITSYNWFPKMKWHTFWNLTSAIETNSAFSWSSAPLNNGISMFYIGTWSTFSVQNSSASGSSDNTGIDGTTDSTFGSCTSFLDVGCYIKSAFNAVASIFSGIGSLWSDLSSVSTGSGQLFYGNGQFIQTWSGYHQYETVDSHRCQLRWLYYQYDIGEDFFRIKSDVAIIDSVLQWISVPFKIFLSPFVSIYSIFTNTIAPTEWDEVCLLGTIYTVDYQQIFAPFWSNPTVIWPLLDYKVLPWQKTFFDYLLLSVLGAISIGTIVYYLNLRSS